MATRRAGLRVPTRQITTPSSGHRVARRHCEQKARPIHAAWDSFRNLVVWSAEERAPARSSGHAWTTSPLATAARANGRMRSVLLRRESRRLRGGSDGARSLLSRTNRSSRCNPAPAEALLLLCKQQASPRTPDRARLGGDAGVQPA